MRIIINGDIGPKQVFIPCLKQYFVLGKNYSR